MEYHGHMKTEYENLSRWMKFLTWLYGIEMSLSEWFIVTRCKVLGHRWKNRGWNVFGGVTYRECSRCNSAQERKRIEDNINWFEYPEFQDCELKDWRKFRRANEPTSQQEA